MKLSPAAVFWTIMAACGRATACQHRPAISDLVLLQNSRRRISDCVGLEHELSEADCKSNKQSCNEQEASRHC